MRSKLFATEGAAARWLERKGYCYGGHLHDEVIGDAVERLQTTCWNNPDLALGGPRATVKGSGVVLRDGPRRKGSLDGRAELNYDVDANKWEARLLTAED